MAEQKAESKLTEFEKGSLLFKQGSRGGELYFLKEGEVELIVRDPETMSERVVAHVGENSVLGTMTFLEGEERSATARCVTAVKAIVVGQIQREKLLAQVPLWFKVLLKDLSSNIRNLNEEYVRLVAKHEVLEKRIALMKTRFKEMSGKGQSVSAADAIAMDLVEPEAPASAESVSEPGSEAPLDAKDKKPVAKDPSKEEKTKAVPVDLDDDHSET